MERIKRRFHRYRVNYDFMYSYNLTSSKCNIIDISEGGMLLKVPQIFDIGDKINLLFNEYPYNISVRAQIIHTKNNYIGVSYLIEDYDDSLFIRNFIHDIKDKNRLHYQR